MNGWPDNCARPFGQAPRFLIRDRDNEYGEAFAWVTLATSIEVLKTPYGAPKPIAVCERFPGRVRRDCLDHLLTAREKRRYRVVKERVGYFKLTRPPHGIEQMIPEVRTSAP